LLPEKHSIKQHPIDSCEHLREELLGERGMHEVRLEDTQHLRQQRSYEFQIGTTVSLKLAKLLNQHIRFQKGVHLGTDAGENEGVAFC